MEKSIRDNSNAFNKWWNTIDKITITLIFVLLSLSAIFVATASTPVAERIGLEQFYFIKRQLVYLLVALFIIITLSNIPSFYIPYVAVSGLLIFVALIILVLIFGAEIKGAKRWISILGITVQPSEFLKPFFILVTGWILSKDYHGSKLPLYKLSLFTYLAVVGLLMLQPDFGMVVTITAVWMGQLFLAGISFQIILFFVLLGVFGIFGAYLLFPHVAFRINSFLDPSHSDNYQVSKSLEAFINGGLVGRGPGEGVVKQHIPDSHSDFIFAVVGEEFGLITCLLVASIYLFIVLRGFQLIIKAKDYFLILAVAGLLMQFGIQAFINMGVALHLLPTKGMTLPFLSYGGSSVFAISLSVGFILALTRKRYGILKNKHLELLS